MKLDLTQLMNKRMPSLAFAFDIDPAAVEDAPLPEADISLRGCVRVEGKVIDNDGYMALRAEVCAEYDTVCDRCLTPLSGTVSFPFERIVTVGGAAVENVDEDDVLWVEEGGIDFDRDVLEAVTLELPLYHLCTEDCPGLCDVCGKKIGAGCTCKNEKEIDPRMEIFQKLLENMKKE